MDAGQLAAETTSWGDFAPILRLPPAEFFAHVRQRLEESAPEREVPLAELEGLRHNLNQLNASCIDNLQWKYQLAGAIHHALFPTRRSKQGKKTEIGRVAPNVECDIIMPESVFLSLFSGTISTSGTSKSGKKFTVCYNDVRALNHVFGINWDITFKGHQCYYAKPPIQVKFYEIVKTSYRSKYQRRYDLSVPILPESLDSTSFTKVRILFKRGQISTWPTNWLETVRLYQFYE